jgi:hypothetical protein
VRGVIAGVLVVNEDYANFDGIIFPGSGAIACGQSKYHHNDYQQSNDLFHGFPPVFLIYCNTLFYGETTSN